MGREHNLLLLHTIVWLDVMLTAIGWFVITLTQNEVQKSIFIRNWSIFYRVYWVRKMFSKCFAKFHGRVCERNENFMANISSQGLSSLSQWAKWTQSPKQWKPAKGQVCHEFHPHYHCYVLPVLGLNHAKSFYLLFELVSFLQVFLHRQQV